MRKTVFAILSIILLTSTVVYAHDLPIDITAIGRQDVPTGRVTHRIGAHLFTEDAQRINDIFDQRVQERQETALTLFDYAAVNYEVDSHNRVMSTAYNLALFSQPANFSTFDTAQDNTNMPTWLIVLIFAVCAAGGFMLALKSISKKRSKESVY